MSTAGEDNRKYTHLKVMQRMSPAGFKHWVKQQKGYISGDALREYFGEFVEADRTCLSIPVMKDAIILPPWFQLVGGASGDEGIDVESLVQIMKWADKMLEQVPEAHDTFRSMDFGLWLADQLDRLKYGSEEEWQLAVDHFHDAESSALEEEE